MILPLSQNSTTNAVLRTIGITISTITGQRVAANSDAAEKDSGHSQDSIHQPVAHLSPQHRLLPDPMDSEDPKLRQTQDLLELTDRSEEEKPAKRTHRAPASTLVHTPPRLVSPNRRRVLNGPRFSETSPVSSPRASADPNLFEHRFPGSPIRGSGWPLFTNILRH
ncbi:uncharacterized protein LOC143361597 [Halictus rubicundus]|uniref:uncharacterized protein LOC143361597 n=1 Tax=Halictus rubicundus TaxID=77578 RepID=UPI0040362EEF